MKAYITDSFQFLAFLLAIIVFGIYGGYAIYVVFPSFVLLLKARKMYMELLFSFFLVLILSDSRQPGLAFAANLKNVYIVLLTLFFFFDVKEFRPVSKMYQIFMPFFFFALICIFFSESYLISIQKTASYFLVLIVISNITFKLIREQADAFLKNLIYFGLLLLLIGLLLKLVFPAVVTLEGRYSGLLGNPNGLGVFCFLFFLLYSTIVHFSPSLFPRGEKFLFIATIIASLVLCESRSAIFSIIIFMLFQYVYRISSFLGFIVFLSSIMLYQYVSSNIVQIITYFGLENYFRLETLDTGSGRLVAWDFAWQNIQNNMFVGKGFNYTEHLYKMNLTFLSVQGHQGNAHNSYLTLWLDTGLIGLILYITAFLSSFLKAAKRTSIAIPAMYAILFSAFFESWLSGSLNPDTIQVWIVLTLLLSLPEKIEIDRNTVLETNG